ncbi:Zinc finger, CCHC-type [Sesbania bispinosa]|nr:Zinc finger, CCHC-type [Sesbania bispinosa]
MAMENPYVQGQLVRSFIRVCVKINVKNPLATGCWVPRKDFPRLWIQFKYEKLQGFCYRCGILGHDNKRCKKDQAMASFDSSRPKYGPSIEVPPARSISSIVTENLNRGPPLSDQVGPTDSPTIHVINELNATLTPFTVSEPNLPGNGLPQPNTLNLIPDYVSGPTKDPCLQRVHLTHTPVPSKITPSLDQPPPNHNINPPLNPTCISIDSTQPEPGLGPASLDLLDIQKEHIGLKEPQIIMDYPSPKHHNTSSFGISLSPGTLFICRQRIAESISKFNQPTPPVYPNPQPPTNHQPTLSNEFVPNYWVEFPPNEPETVSPSKIESSPEKICPRNLFSLSMGFQEKLAITLSPNQHSSGLKRPRIDDDLHDERHTKVQLRNPNLLTLGESSQMAEEVGLIMPPPQP